MDYIVYSVHTYILQVLYIIQKSNRTCFRMFKAVGKRVEIRGEFTFLRATSIDFGFLGRNYVAVFSPLDLFRLDKDMVFNVLLRLSSREVEITA